MMTDEFTDTRVWTCPICGDDIEVHLTWRSKAIGLVRTMVVDDVDARLHMAWHSMCTCDWTDSVRTPNPACEMHP